MLLALAGCSASNDNSTADNTGDATTNGTPTVATPTIDTPTTTSRSLPGSITMVSIPGGEFTMGGTTVANDAPEVTVTVSSFTLSATEVTNAQYVEFLNAALDENLVLAEATTFNDPCGSNVEVAVIGTGDAPYAGETYLQLGETGGCTSDGHAEAQDNQSWISFDAANNQFTVIDATKADWPVNWVKWYGAAAFADYYSVALPTEAQWEYAARGGAQLEYPTDDGTLTADKANYNGDIPGVLDADGHSFAVASYPANPYGLYDMGGNVWEWCADYYSASFYQSDVSDPVNTVAGSDEQRVRRGGSWNYHATTLLTYARASDLEDRGNNHFGFRIASD